MARRPVPVPSAGRLVEWRVSILSIQSSVAYGHVGNSAAVFPLQRLGVEVWPVHTVHFSNHTGYGQWRGPLLPADDVRAVIRGVEERGAFPAIDAVLSGYQGGEDIGDVILDAVARVKAANPSAIYACDPVMGNAKSGCFVHPAIPVLLRERVVPQADLITPNQFELGYLTGTEPRTVEETLASVELARTMGPSTVLVTSVERPDAPADTIEMMAVTDDGAWIVQTPASAHEGQRFRRRHRRAVHRPPARDVRPVDGAGPHGEQRLRPAPAHARLRRAGAAARAVAGGDRLTAHAVRGQPPALTPRAAVSAVRPATSAASRLREGSSS